MTFFYKEFKSKKMLFFFGFFGWVGGGEGEVGSEMARLSDFFLQRIQI